MIRGTLTALKVVALMLAIEAAKVVLWIGAVLVLVLVMGYTQW